MVTTVRSVSVVYTRIWLEANRGGIGYHSWRRLGDLIASIYALGYHEKLDNYPDCPLFLTELRKAVSARVYSGDKNVAIFLGRPPRMEAVLPFPGSIFSRYLAFIWHCTG